MKQRLLITSFVLLFCSFVVGIFDFFVGTQPESSIPKIEGSMMKAETEEKDEETEGRIARWTQRGRGLPFAYLIAWGDIMLSRGIGYLNKKEGYDRIFGGENYHPIAQFTDCTSENCQLFFNLESLFHPKDNDIPRGGFTFRANTGNIEVLRQLRYPFPQQIMRYSQGIPLVLSLANNHTINGGYEGMVETRDILHFWGDISHVGAGVDVEQARRIAQHGFNITCGTEGCRSLDVCFQAYSYEGKEKWKVGGGFISWNALEEEQMLADLEEMKNLNCDVKVLSLHRGAEYRLHPNQRQRNLAHKLIDKGADLILGGHSHVPGEIEQYQGKYIFYSLGNFIFDQDRGKTAQGTEFDYIYDYELEGKTVPTYIAMLAKIKIISVPQGVRIVLDQIAMSRMKEGIHQQLDEETRSEILSHIWKEI